MPRLERDGAAVAVELVDPGRVGQRVLQGRRSGRCSVSPPKNGIAADAPQSRAGVQLDEVEREGVAGLGALDVERAGLRVDERQVDLRARQVVDAAQIGRRTRRRTTAAARCRAVPCATGATPPNVYAYCSRVGRELDDVHGRNLLSAASGAQPYVVRSRSATRVTPSSASVPLTSRLQDVGGPFHAPLAAGHQPVEVGPADQAARAPRATAATMSPPDSDAAVDVAPRPGRRPRRRPRAAPPAGPAPGPAGGRRGWTRPPRRRRRRPRPGRRPTVWMPLTPAGPARSRAARPGRRSSPPGRTSVPTSSATVPLEAMQAGELERLGGQQVRTTRPGAARRPRTVRSDSDGGIVRPLRTSRSRAPATGVSTVSTSAS